jgi:hypothetical protein
MAKYRKFRPFIAQPDDQSIRHIPLTRGMFAIVDVEDYVRLSQWNWYAARIRKTNIFYAARFTSVAEGRRMIFMHRELVPSELPETDHRNRNTLDNRKQNLSPCQRGDNQANRGKDKRNTSGYKGVSWSKSNEKWQAQTSVGGKNVHLGFRDKPEDAYKLYCDFVISVKGKFASF